MDKNPIEKPKYFTPPQYLGRSLNAKLERMKTSEQTELIFPREELEQIRQVNLWIDRILLEVKRKQTENPQKYKNEDYERQVIELIMKALDKLYDLWLCKFSTSNNARRGDDISPKASDSIYYMTPSGSSLRFKMIMFDKNNHYANHPDEYGIHYVKQDFATFIYFTNHPGGSATPIVKESNVKEILDDKFISLTKQETPIQKDYHTGFATLTDQYGLWSVTSTGKQERDDVLTHEGSLVNKIFFKRFKNN